MKKLIMTVALFLGLATTAQADTATILDCTLGNGLNMQIIFVEDKAFIEGRVLDTWVTELKNGVGLVVVDMPYLNARLGYNVGSGELVGMNMGTGVVNRLGHCYVVTGASL